MYECACLYGYACVHMFMYACTHIFILDYIFNVVLIYRFLYFFFSRVYSIVIKDGVLFMRDGSYVN